MPLPHVIDRLAQRKHGAQIDRAIEAGIDVTHIDTHMGSVVHPKFISSYLKLADEYGVPAFLPNITK
ncbi:MAG: ChbG/HpnK family deacetylase, partial [Candidatus Poribacteria bacterium]|nr:ChbG/HpnK family deacetylase [Candidatus Poribacteria bacterium]